jgi:ankyrin repeat protein
MKIFKFLCENKVDLKLKNGCGETPLHYACWYGHDKIVKYLCSNKVDVNATTEEGSTPLHYGLNISFIFFNDFKIHLLKAARMNYYEIVSELCKNEANFEFNDKNRSTPIDIGKLLKLNL